MVKNKILNDVKKIFEKNKYLNNIIVKEYVKIKNEYNELSKGELKKEHNFKVIDNSSSTSKSDIGNMKLSSTEVSLGFYGVNFEEINFENIVEFEYFGTIYILKEYSRGISVANIKAVIYNVLLSQNGEK